MCTGQLSNFVCYLHRNHPELHGPSAPGPSEFEQPSGTLQNLTVRDLIRHLHRNPPELCLLCACTGQLNKFVCYLHRNHPEFHGPSAPGSSELDQPSAGAVCAGTLRNLICNLHQNSPELHQLSAPKPSGTSSAICTGTLRNLVCYLHRNPPELHQPAAPELSGTSSAILISNLHRKTPEPSGTFSGTWCCSCTGSHQSYSGLKTS